MKSRRRLSRRWFPKSLTGSFRVGILSLGLMALAISTLRAGPSAGEDYKVLAAKIDQLLARGWSAAGVERAAEASAAEFLRRVYLDIAGRVPEVSEPRAFFADTSPGQREPGVERLLGGAGCGTHLH